MRYLFSVFLILCSCLFKEPIIGGECPPIDLSKEELLFNAQEGVDSVIIKEKMLWWFEGIEKGCKFIIPADEPNYCDNNYCNSNENEIVKIEGSWFDATKINEYTLLVSVKRNDTGRKRDQRISITGTNEIGNKVGECFAKISVSQSAE